jgi:hypothetical protein
MSFIYSIESICMKELYNNLSEESKNALSVLRLPVDIRQPWIDQFTAQQKIFYENLPDPAAQ